MEFKQQVQNYISKPVAWTMIIMLCAVLAAALYVNDWKASGYYYVCENPLPYAFPPNHCLAQDEWGNDVYLLKGDTIGTKPHKLTSTLTILFYSIIVLFAIINHWVYKWKHF
jgi:hypothetical protein